MQSLPALLKNSETKEDYIYVQYVITEAYQLILESKD